MEELRRVVWAAKSPLKQLPLFFFGEPVWLMDKVTSTHKGETPEKRRGEYS